MADIIHQTENTETGNPELWITIKDASDLLGISERHTWRITLQNVWKTQKLLNNDRKKTYILRADVEKYYQDERERQKLGQLSSSDIHVVSDIGVLDKSDIKNKPKSDIKNLPVLLSDYKNMLFGLQKKQEQLIKSTTVWKTTAIWLTILAVFISGLLGFFLYDNKKVLSDIKKELSARVSALSDRATEAQRALLIAKDALLQKEVRISGLEQAILKEKIKQLEIKERGTE